MLAGPWVDRTDEAINEHRKTEARVLVLGADGAPAPNARVRLEQLSHDFALGFVAPADGWPAGYDAGAAVWRVFNTVSLAQHTRWADREDAAGRFDAAPAEAVARAAKAAGLAVWWGPVISADAGRQPDRVARMDRAAMGRALQGHVDRVVGDHGRGAAAFDLYANALDHDLIGERFGDAMLRRLFDRAEAIAPGASLRIHMRDVLDRRRSLEAVRRVTAISEAFVRFDALALEQHYLGRVEHDAVRLGLSRIEGLGVPIVIASLEVTGEQPLETAMMLETVLRVLFASERVTGICLAGVTPGDAADPGAALFDDEGEATPAGAVLDSLFTRQWRTDHRAAADQLGNVDADVFPGNYRISATLPDGVVATSIVHIPRAADEKLIVVQPDQPADPEAARDADAERDGGAAQ